MADHDDVAITPAGDFIRRAHASLPARSMPVRGSPAPALRRLFTTTTPIPGESLRGLVVRACGANYLPNSWGLLQHCGLTHRNRVLVSEDPEVMTADLAYAIGTTEDEILSRRYEVLTPEHVSFFGLDVHRGRLENRIRRFSPLSLAEHPYHRAIWEVRDLPFCPYGWDILQDRCLCDGDDGVLQGWTRTLSPVDCCDRCGDPLSWLEPIPVPDAMRDDLSLMLTLVGTSDEERALGTPLPEPLAEADRSDLFELVWRLSQAVMPENDNLQDPASALARCEALRSVCRAVIDWPSGIRQLTRSDVTTRAMWQRLGMFYSAVGGAPRGRVSFRGFQLSRPGKARNPKTAPTRPFKLLGMRPAGELARMSDDTLTALWEDGVFTQHTRRHGEKVLPAVGREELLAFATRWHDRVERGSFAFMMGTSLHGVEQMIALGIVEATGPSMPGDASSLTSSAVDGFMRKVEACADAHVEDPISLRRAASAIGGRLKPWGPIFAALLDRSMSFVLVTEGRRLIDRIHIGIEDMGRVGAFAFDRAEFPDIVFSDLMNQTDVRETLNISAKNEPVLKSLKSQGSNPQTFAVKDVEHLAARIITITEIAALMRLALPSALQRLKSAGWPQTMPSAYVRSETEPYLDLIAQEIKQGRKAAPGSTLFEQVFMKGAACRTAKPVGAPAAVLKKSRPGR